MSGKPGRSGGHNRVSVEQHWLMGTFRNARHGARLAQAAVSPADGRWCPTSEQREALGAAGRRLLDEWLAGYALTAPEGVLLYEAATAADAVVEWKRKAATEGPTQVQASRLWLAWSKHLASLIVQLKVQR